MSVKVVFITGTGRSGSTLLSNAIGSLPDALSAGEVKWLFRRGLSQQGFCGCRRPVRDCPAWGEALTRVFGSIPDREQAEELDRRLSALVRTRRVPGLVARGLSGGRRQSPAQAEMSELLGRLLQELAAVAGVSTVVDSTRLPAYGALLEASPEVDLRVIHLVRDPRAVAWSWKRESATQAVDEFEETMEQFSALKSSSMWLTSSTMIPLLWRPDGRMRLTVRYEDFVTDPELVLREVAAFCELQPDLSFIRDGALDLAESHAAAGNPNRVRRGPVRLRIDDEWRARMPRRDRLTVGAMTWTRRRAYGY